MTARPPRPELTALLAETRWVRRLAGTLVADPHDADDLAQDACLVALARPPAGAANLRAWLRTVMRNLLLQQERSASRRQRRETAAEAENRRHAEAVDDLVERATAQRAVVDAVLALAPAFRDTVLLRYFEDLPPRTIAQRMQVPVATVHSRLQRAHAQLRLSLDKGSSWRRAVLPLPLIAPSIASPAVVLAMNTKVVAVAAAVLVSSAALWIGLRSPTVAETVPQTHTDPIAAAAPRGAGADAPASSDARVTRVPAPVAPAAAAAAAKLRRCTGRVVDAEGRAAPGLQLAVGDLRTVSDGAGAFDVATSERQLLTVRADQPGWCTILEGVVRSGAEPPPVLVVVAPALRIEGHVRSTAGEPLADASVRVVWPDDLRARLQDISDGASEASIAARSRADGAFELDAAAVRGAELLATAEAFVPQRRPLPAAHDAAMVILLERLDSVAGTVRGQVVDPNGRAVPGARVGLGAALARCDAQGNFAIEDDGKAAALSASAAGHRRGLLERGERGFAAFVVLELGAAPLSIRGRVVDETGKGLAGVAVWPNDTTVLCESSDPIVVEGIASGLQTMAELRERFERGEFAGLEPWQVMRANATVTWPRVRTAADGSFTIDGLEDRPYRLRALDNDTLLMTEKDGIAAGSADVRLVLDQSLLFAEVAGVVVTRTGAPVENARISVQIDAQSLRGLTMHERAVATATTDAQGRFTLSRVPKARAYFRIEGDDLLPVEPGRGREGGIFDLCRGKAHDLRLEVALRMHVQVELADPGRADAIAVLDEAGANLALTVFRGRSRSDTDALPLAEGRSPVFVVPDTARTLVLTREGKEVGREVLELRAGGVNTLRL
jgi:RNA polymerase sigma-70 factor (ECF subfamily)